MNGRTALGLVSVTGLAGLLAGCIRFRSEDIQFYPKASPTDLNETDRADWNRVERTMNRMSMLRNGMLDRYNSLSYFDDTTRDCLRPGMREVENLFKEAMTDRAYFQHALLHGDEPNREHNFNQIESISEQLQDLNREADRCGPSHEAASLGLGNGMGWLFSLALSALFLGFKLGPPRKGLRLGGASRGLIPLGRRPIRLGRSPVVGRKRWLKMAEPDGQPKRKSLFVSKTKKRRRDEWDDIGASSWKTRGGRR